jgi:multicomponent K+:H+ antiporter subunit D
MILQAGLANPMMPWIFAVVLVTGLMNLTALARAGSVLFFKTDPEAGAARLPDPAYLVPVAALTAVAVLLVIYAGPIYDLALAAAEQIDQPSLYIDTVLAPSAPPPLHH